MPPLVVNMLKVIQVQDEQGADLPLGLFQTGAAQLLSGAFIRQPGQGVSLRLTPQKGLHGNGCF